MAMDITKGTHTVFYPSKMISTRVGHIYNMVLADDTDNGRFAKRGDYVSFDQYEADAPADSTASFVVREQAVNGNYYVEVITGDEEIVVIYESIIGTRTDRDLRMESLWVNKAGSVVKGLSLHVGDIFELSANGFTADPVIGTAYEIDSTTGKLATA